MQALSKPQPREMPRIKMGVLLLIASESVFFLLLILAYVFYRSSPANRGGPTPFNALDVEKTGIYSVCLYLSSLTVWLAERGLRRGSDRLWQGWLLLTIILGAAFAYGQATEYLHLLGEQNVAPGTDLFAGTFFVLTGFHGLHVIGGLILLLIVLGLAMRGTFKGGKHATAVETVSYYWHFVDAVWVIIFPTVYLWSLMGH